LLGLVALFKNDLQSARKAFDNASVDDPTNPVPFLNAAFTNVELGEYQKAADRMRELMRLAPPANAVLRGTAYMIWGAALMNLHDAAGADRMLAKATNANPDSATAFALWAEIKSLGGDQEAADRLDRLAGWASATFENYQEVAALYFHLPLAGVQPVTRNRFANPTVAGFGFEQR
jgi:Tfp pilus assembly protein PilF